MRFTLRLLRVATIVLVFASLAACSKKKDDPEPGMYTSWTVDGRNETATGFTAALIGTDVIASGTYRTAPNDNPTGIYLAIPNAVGTYPLTSSSYQVISYIVPNGPDLSRRYDGTSGSVVVTSVVKKGTSTTIVGTFSFTGSDGTTSKTVTNGKFSFTFTS